MKSSGFPSSFKVEDKTNRFYRRGRILGCGELNAVQEAVAKGASIGDSWQSNCSLLSLKCWSSSQCSSRPRLYYIFTASMREIQLFRNEWKGRAEKTPFYHLASMTLSPALASLLLVPPRWSHSVLVLEFKMFKFGRWGVKTPIATQAWLSASWAELHSVADVRHTQWMAVLTPPCMVCRHLKIRINFSDPKLGS